MTSPSSHDFIAAKRCAPSMLLFRKLHALCKEKEASREGKMSYNVISVAIVTSTDPRVAQWFDKIVKEVVENNASRYSL